MTVGTIWYHSRPLLTPLIQFLTTFTMPTTTTTSLTVRPFKAFIVSLSSALIVFFVSWSVVFSDRLLLLSAVTLPQELQLLQQHLQLQNQQQQQLQSSSSTTRITFNNYNIDDDLLIQQLTQLAQSHLLTIAVDNRGSCPDLCTFVHPLLPPWIRYRYIDFHTEKDLAAKIDADEAAADYQYHHILIVARTNIIELANWGIRRRQNSTTKHISVGLWHNADERVYHGEINKVYQRFDYVIRNYFQAEPDTGKLWGFDLHALGNLTCGTHRQSLPDYSANTPTWGVHYSILEAHTMHVLTQRHGTSVWPLHLRPTNCSFMGNVDTKRSVHQRQAMKEAMETVASDLHCDIRFSTGFAKGHGKFEYFNYDLANTKVGLAPRGSTYETHRLTELLQMGTVPAVVSSPYLYAPFIDIPAIIGDNWTDVAHQVREYIVNKPDELQALSIKGAVFYRQLEDCMRADMDFILRGAFGLWNQTAIATAAAAVASR